MDILMDSVRNDSFPAKDDWIDLLVAPTPYQERDFFPDCRSTLPTHNIGATAEDNVAGSSLFPALDTAFLDFDPEQYHHTSIEGNGKRDPEGNYKLTAPLANAVSEYVQQDMSFLSHGFDSSNIVFPDPSTPSRWEEVGHAPDGCPPTSIDSNAAETKEASSPNNEVDVGDAPETLLPMEKKTKQTTLVLEDATPDTMYSLLEILFQTDTKMTMNVN